MRILEEEERRRSVKWTKKTSRNKKERRRSVKWTKKHQGTKKKGEGTWKGKKEVRLSVPYSCFTSKKRTITYSYLPLFKVVFAPCVCCFHTVKEKR